MINRAQIAATLAKHGYAVFRLAPNKRKPFATGWQKEATTNTKEARLMFEQNPKCNIGIATGSASGLVVLDVDTKDGARGIASLKMLGEQIPALKDAPRIRTPSGGLHLYFRHTGTRLRNSVKSLADGLDIRAEGGLVVAAGSAIDGVSYKWLNGSSAATELPRLPRALRERIETATTTDRESLLTEKITEGNRNDTLFSAAIGLIKQGMKRDALRVTLKALNASFAPPLPASEVRAVIDSALRGKVASKSHKSVPRKSLDIETTESLLRRELARRDFIQRNLLMRRASSLLVGQPKTGKSTFAMSLALNAVQAIDLEWPPPLDFVPDSAISVAYADLQQGRHLYKDLVLTFAPDEFEEPENYEKFVKRSARLIRIENLPRHEDDGAGLRALSEVIEEHRLRLVFIDSLEEIKPVESSRRSAQQLDSGVLQPITDLAHTHKRGPHVCVIYQRNKDKSADDPVSMVAATNALAAAADDILGLKNPRDEGHKMRRVLSVVGRNVRVNDYALELVEGGYNFIGNAVEVITAGSVERAVLRHLKAKTGEALHPIDIAKAISKRDDSVRRALAGLVSKREVRQLKNGYYTVVE